MCDWSITKHASYRTDAFYQDGQRIGYKDTSSALTGWKKQDDLQFLNEVSSVPLQQGLRHLQTAFTNFFEQRAKFPNFKKKRNGGSATFTKAVFKLKDGQVFIANSERSLNIRWSRSLPKNVDPSSITIALSPSGKWFVSILCDVTITPHPKTNQKVGVDMGISALITTSDGEKFTNPKSLRKAQKKLRRLNKALARKQKGSRNRYKARIRVAKCHEKIANIRKDNQQKITSKLVRKNQVVAVETLNIKGMLGNHQLARAISDAGWGETVRQLAYKATWYGRSMAQIDRWYPSSKRCSSCGHTVAKLPLNIRQWDCPSCGTHHDRDENAGKNILAVGLTVLACGASVRPKSSKDVGNCETLRKEAGNNGSDAVKTRKQRQRSEESPPSKSKVRRTEI